MTSLTCSTPLLISIIGQSVDLLNVSLVKTFNKAGFIKFKGRTAFERITPVNPPIVNKAMNPIAKNNGVVNLKLPPYKVAIQENLVERNSNYHYFDLISLDIDIINSSSNRTVQDSYPSYSSPTLLGFIGYFAFSIKWIIFMKYKMLDEFVYIGCH